MLHCSQSRFAVLLCVLLFLTSHVFWLSHSTAFQLWISCMLLLFIWSPLCVIYSVMCFTLADISTQDFTKTSLALEAQFGFCNSMLFLSVAIAAAWLVAGLIGCRCCQLDEYAGLLLAILKLLLQPCKIVMASCLCSLKNT